MANETPFKMNSGKILKNFYLMLLSVFPMASLISNIIPSIFGIKFSWLYWGLVLLLGLFVFFLLYKNKWIFFLLILFFFNSLIRFDHTDIVVFVNVFNGMLMITNMIGLLTHEEKIDVRNMKLVQLMFYTQVLLIIVFGILQYLRIMPLAISNHALINYTLTDAGEKVGRINGLLFHPFDFASLIFFSSIGLILKTNNGKYVKLFIVLALIAMAKIKMAIVLMLLVILTEFLIIDRRYRVYKLLFSGIFVLIGLFGVLYFIPQKQMEHFYINSEFPYFDPEFLTGRGGIWNVYGKGILEQFNIGDYLFGLGIGNYHGLFEMAANPDIWYRMDGKKILYYPSPHNSFLQMFLMGGVFWSILFIWWIIKRFKVILRKYFITNPRIILFYIILPFLTIGNTVALININFYWACMLLSLFTFLEGNRFVLKS